MILEKRTDARLLRIDLTISLVAKEVLEIIVSTNWGSGYLNKRYVS